MSQILKDTLTSLVSTVSDIKAQVAVSLTLHERNTHDLERHIKRTDLLEDKVDMLRKNQAWWSITGKILIVVMPIAVFIYQLTRP